MSWCGPKGVGAQIQKKWGPEGCGPEGCGPGRGERQEGVTSPGSLQAARVLQNGSGNPNAHFRWSTHGSESRPRFHEESSNREEKRKKFVAGEGKKTKFWAVWRRAVRRRAVQGVQRRVSNAGCPTQSVQRRVSNAGDQAKGVQRRVSNAGGSAQGARRRGCGLSGAEESTRGDYPHTDTQTHQTHRHTQTLHWPVAKMDWPKLDWPMTPLSTLFMLLYSSVISSCASLNSSCNAAVTLDAVVNECWGEHVSFDVDNYHGRSEDTTSDSS